MDHREVRMYVGKSNLVYDRALCRNVVYTIRNHTYKKNRGGGGGGDNERLLLKRRLPEVSNLVQCQIITLTPSLFHLLFASN